MRQIWNFFSSRTTGIVLLLAISVVLMVGAALPNPSLMLPRDAEKLRAENALLYWFGDNFNSMKVGRSPVFGVTGLLLIVSTFTCTVERIVKRLKTNSGEPFELPDGKEGITVYLTAQDGKEKLSAILHDAGWKVDHGDVKGRMAVFARKGSIGFWGSIFFHATLISLIVGLLVYYFYGFAGTMVITEGQAMEITEQNLARVERRPLLGLHLPQGSLRLNAFSTQYEGETAVDYTADVTVTDAKTGRSRQQTMKVNNPFSFEGVDFILTQRGHSPRFVLFRQDKVVHDSYMALKMEENATDEFDVTGEGIVVEARFFPDFARNQDGTVFTKSRRLLNPYFGLDIKKEGQRLFRGVVGKGQGIVFGEYRLVFEDLRTWTGVDLVREPGLGFFFWSSMVGLFGVLVRVLDPERRITALFAEGQVGMTVTLYPFSKNFEGMFSEVVDNIVQQLKTSQKGAQ